MLDLLGR
jgi:hypothetical protein